ncbi:hypothetical protein JZ751_010617 [Albula glossodonta]|uniref:cGMP-dependent protein kinase interacting domain-containing protein n=1 Tax=Albula glossodonta TaxID=121402 RepID=A0A8T2N2Q2_9TELE|nr:hypothetical protein JZ751_010617 [Albula glossodonta]
MYTCERDSEQATLPDLKADNQRLKDENGALIRVISKLSNHLLPPPTPNPTTMPPYALLFTPLAVS